mmetsp:Transcript_30001/g.93226  ORF Transcript_30001/g.93226 Transcript_30001/m.93226 type:complete len:231 (-) Transcript_30001:20-712(-)
MGAGLVKDAIAGQITSNLPSPPGLKSLDWRKFDTDLLPGLPQPALAPQVFTVKKELDEGILRAGLASKDLEDPSATSAVASLGARRPRGQRSALTSSAAQSLIRSDEAGCSAMTLRSYYEGLVNALAKAQRIAFPKFPDRWLELQHVDDLTRFLERADVSMLTRPEVSKLGKAFTAAQLAGHDARMVIDAPLKDSERGVPSGLAMAISNMQMYAKGVAAHGFRCRATNFL